MTDLISLYVTSQSIAVWVKKLCSFDAILYFSKEDNFLVLFTYKYYICFKITFIAKFIV